MYPAMREGFRRSTFSKSVNDIRNEGIKQINPACINRQTLALIQKNKSMALNPELIRFFLSRISHSTFRTFGSEVSQLFHHLSDMIKDNPIFNKYEHESAHWKSWLGEAGYQLGTTQFPFPSEFENAKSLSYTAYKVVSEQKDSGSYYPAGLLGIGNHEEARSQFNQLFLDYLSQALDDIIRANPELEVEEHKKVIGDTVFIIHGHDNNLKTEIQLLLVRAGVRNIVLHEQPDSGRTLIDKLIQEGKKSNYAIALLSPDDTADGGNKRARQNVILEIGYFMGFLGKERIRILIKGDIEVPSDIHGILYEKYDTSGNWKLRILKELNAVGIFVDYSEILKNL